MTTSLYLIIERHKRTWKGPLIRQVTKKRPRLLKPTMQALVHLQITIPDDTLYPKPINVVVGTEHIQAVAAGVQPLRS